MKVSQHQQQYHTTKYTASSYEQTSHAISTKSNLRSCANYKSFKPTSIATFNNYKKWNSINTSSKNNFKGSIGAVSGINGILLFYTTNPQEPILKLDYALPNNHSTRISSLAFPNDSHDSLLLAAGKGNNVMVWDVSGHMMSPMISRIQHETRNSKVSCIKWKKQCNASTLLTTFDKDIYAWDIRQSTINTKPIYRYSPSNSISFQLLHVESNENHEIACIDTCGYVHIFDDRSDKEISSFEGYDCTGIGISSIDDGWITWGCDYNYNDDMTTTVKYWSSDKKRNDSYSDYYWAECNSSNDLLNEQKEINDTNEKYKMNIIHSSPYTSCVRVSPYPFHNNFITIASIPSYSNTVIETHLWNKNDIMSNVNQWNDVNDTDCLKRLLGKCYDKGNLIGAELSTGVSMSYNYPLFNSSGIELQLCCLSDTGFVTIYGIPDAQDVRKSQNEMKKFQENILTETNDNNQTISDTVTNELSIQDKIKKLSPAITASEEYDTDLDELLLADHQQQMLHQEQEKQSSNAIGGHHPTTSPDSPTTTNNTTNTNDTRHIPCPRLCGATFCQGGYGGGLIIFHNKVNERLQEHSNDDGNESNKNVVSLTSLVSNVIHHSLQVEQQHNDQEGRSRTTSTGTTTLRTMHDYMQITPNKYNDNTILSNNKNSSSIVIYTNRYDYLFLSKEQRRQQQLLIQQKQQRKQSLPSSSWWLFSNNQNNQSLASNQKNQEERKKSNIATRGLDSTAQVQKYKQKSIGNTTTATSISNSKNKTRRKNDSNLYTATASDGVKDVKLEDKPCLIS